MTIRFASFAAAALAATLTSCAIADTQSQPPADLLDQIAAYQKNEAVVQQNLATFDTLDFDVYTNQKWDRLTESHAEDILVHYPDGSTTTGLHDHVEMLKPMFVFAPDTRIQTHPVRFGTGEWTAVTGELEGTFTEPMPIGNGQSIPPTGKAFKISMVTIGHWTEDGVMDEEYLFWDNQGFMKQIGLGQ